MKYSIRINTRVKNTHVYKILKRTTGNTNLITKIFIRIFAGKKEEY